MTDARLLIYEPHAGGHQTEFLTWLAQAWTERSAGGTLVVAAPTSIARDRTDLLDAVAASGGRVVWSEAPASSAGLSSLANAVAVHRLGPVGRLMARHRPAHTLLMSFEHFVSPLAARVPLPGDGRLAALSLRPPVADSGRRWAQRARAGLFAAAMRHPRLDTLHSLDPLAVPALRALGARVRVDPVPDPVPDDPVRLTRAQVRHRHGIEPERRLFVLLGVLDARKGALLAAEALSHLPPSAAAQTAVLFAGRLASAIATPFHAALARAREATSVQAVVQDAFVPADDIQSYVAAADGVLLVYTDDHIGSSGFQMRAAGAGVPVLCTEAGLMGARSRTHRLGPTVRPTPADIAKALTAWAEDGPGSAFDAAAAAAFARRHTPDAFARALLGPYLCAAGHPPGHAVHFDQPH